MRLRIRHQPVTSYQLTIKLCYRFFYLKKTLFLQKIFDILPEMLYYLYNVVFVIQQLNWRDEIREIRLERNDE